MNLAVRACKASIEDVGRILRPHSMAIDAEFLIVCEAVSKTLKIDLSSPHPSHAPESDLQNLGVRLAELLDGYLSHLERLQKDTQQLLRALQSPRLQHALLLRSTLIFQDMASIVSAINMSRPVSSFEAKETPPKIQLAASLLPMPASPSASDSSPEDPKANLFWLENWTSDDYFVPWQQFQCALATAFPMACLASFSSLQYLLDFSCTGFVSKTRFLGLAKLALSFDEFVDLGTHLMKRLWFLGFLSKTEATMLLHQEPVGTYLVRLHKNARASLVCSYVSHNRSIQHHIVQRDRLGYSMLNCAGVFPSLEEMFSNSAFLKVPYPEAWIRSQHFFGDANREESESLLEGLPPGTFAIRLQPIGCIPLSALQLPSSGPMSSHSSHKMSNFKETAFVFSAVTNSGSIRHTYAPRDIKGRLVVGGKYWSDATSYLAEHKSVYATPFTPSHPRFRARLDSQLVVLVSPTPTRPSTRHTSGLNASSSSLSSSTGKIPRSLRSTTSDSDLTTSPAHSRDDLSSPANCRCDSPLFDEDTPIFELGPSAPTVSHDPSPFHSANGLLGGSLGMSSMRVGFGNHMMAPPVPGVHTRSNPPSTANASVTHPANRHHTIEHNFPLNASLTVEYAQSMGNRGSGSREKRASIGSAWPNANASDSVPPSGSGAVIHHPPSTGSANRGGVPQDALSGSKHSTQGALHGGVGAHPSNARPAIASSSAAIFAPSANSSQFQAHYSVDSKTLAESNNIPFGGPLTRVKWTPLTDQEINPLSLSYKDVWADLLRYYHVPVPEAKLPPKTAAAPRSHSRNSSSSTHHSSSKSNGNPHPVHHSHGGLNNAASSHASSRS